MSKEPNTEREILGARLREAREYLGFSQDDVAKYLGIARSALSYIEGGQRRVDAIELEKLSKLYKRPITAFTQGDVEKTVEPDVELLARQASELSDKDREELLRFAEFLRSRQQPKEN